MKFPAKVKIVEVGPRDGLQNENVAISAENKIRYIELLNEAGFSEIEVTSFVSPKAIPQLKDAREVFPAIQKKSGVRYPVLVPNERGMRDAIEAGVRDVSVFTAASESFAQANIHASIRESIERFKPVTQLAEANGIRVRGYISTAFGCPYEGVVAPEKVYDVCKALLDLGVAELSIGDTIGVATPNQVLEITPKVIEIAGADRVALHFHDTRGTALANILAGLSAGAAIFDSASGGAGGCPYAPGAAGNVATEDVLYMLHGMGIATGIDLDKVVLASEFLAPLLSRPLSSKYLQAALRQR